MTANAEDELRRREVNGAFTAAGCGTLPGDLPIVPDSPARRPGVETK